MRQTKKQLRRIIAVLLSVVLVFSTFEGISFTGYAVENTGVGDIDTETHAQEEEKEDDTNVSAVGTTEEEVQSSEEKAVETEEGTQEEPSSEGEKNSLTQEEGISQESALEENVSEVSATESEEEVEEPLTDEELRINGEDGEAYTGTAETYENGWRELIICESDFEEFYNNAETGDADAQKSFDDAAIEDILTVHAEDTDKFDSIKIEYNVITDHKAISQSLWNAVAQFGGRKEIFYANFFYGKEETLELRWSFKNPEVAEQDVNIEVTKLELQSDAGAGAVIRFANTSFPAEKVGLDTYTNNTEKYQMLAVAFGDTYIKLAAYEGTGEIEGIQGEYWTGENVKEAGFGFEDIKRLTPETEYTLKKFSYKGDIWTDDENGRTGLDINYLDMEKDGGLTTEEVRKILETYHKGKIYDEIYIIQPSGESNVIYKDMADMLYPYLNTDTKDCRLRFGFMEENGDCKEWKLWNPQEMQDSDQTVAADMTIADGKISVTIRKKPDFRAEKAELSFSMEKRDGTEASAIIDILGTDEGQLILRKSDNREEDVWAWYGSNDECVWLDIDAASEMTEGVSYTVERYEYAGDIWTWTDDSGEHTGLNINYGGAGVENLDVDTIREILSRRPEGEKFDEIRIEQPAEGKENFIPGEAVMEACKYLDPETEAEDRRVIFVFIDESNEAATEWRIVNPKADQEDQTVSAELIVTEDTVAIKVTKKPEFEADRTEVGFTRNEERDGSTVASIKKVLDAEENGIAFHDDTGKIIDGYYGYDADNVWLGIGIEELEAGKEYKAGKSVYRGDCYTWTDEADDTKIYAGLNINYRAAGKEEALTAEEIQQILSGWGSERFDEIFLEQPCKNDSNVISKAAADVLYQYLKSKEDNEERRLFFVFVNAETGSRMEWGLMNPQEEQEGDQTANAVMDISGDNVSLTISSPVLKAERVTFGVGKEMTKDPDSAVLIKLFGEAECDLVFQADGEQDVYGISRVDRNTNIFWISPYDVSRIRGGRTYSVGRDRYLGDVTEDDILISSFNRLYDQERFTPAQLEEIVAYYRSKGRSFRSVTIQQKRVDGIPDIIDKDLYNYARRILDDTPDRRLSFSFCGCQGTDKNRLPLNWEKQEWDNLHKYMEYAEFGYYYLQDDFIWSFVNPTEAVKDIDANVTLKTEKNKGITIQLADNRPYSADDVSFSYYCDPQAVTGTALEAALGKPEDFGGDKATDLFVLDKETNAPDNRVSACYMTNEEWGDGYGNPPYNKNYSLYFNNVREWIPGREFWVTKMEYLSDMAEKEFQLPALPEGAQNPVWQSHNTDIATIDGDKLKQVDGNEGYVHFSVTYTLGGEEYQKAYRVYMAERVIPVTKIRFDRKSLTMEAPPKNADWEALEYLEVKYYPANATIDMDQSSLKWTTSDNKVVTLVRDSSGRCGGEIKAVGAGKATIRAEYKEGIYAECEVTVEEPIVIEDEKWPEPYAVTNFDTSLADVGFPKDDNGEWRWKDPGTSLAPYADMEWHLFAAVYTRNADKKTMEAMVGVRMISIAGAEIFASEYEDIPAALTKDKRILLDVYPHVENGDYTYDIAQNDKYRNKIDIRWSATPAGILSAASGVDGTNAQWFTANTPAGKKNITVSIVNKQTNKVLAKDSITINVTNKPVMDFGAMKVAVDGVLQEYNQWIRLDRDAKAAGVIAFSTDNAENKAYTLTAKSSDPSVLQVKPDGSSQIAYTIKNYGKAQLTVTANDEIKSSWNIEVSIPDKMPQIVQSQVTINKAGTDKSALLTIAYADGYHADGENAVTVDGSDFTFANGRLALKNTNLKGTAQAKVRIKCTSDDGRDSFTAEKTVKVKIVDKLPKVTIKQTKKVNAFYKNTADSHAGTLTVGVGNANVSKVRSDASSDFDIVPADGRNVYKITLKEGKQNAFQPKARVLYTVTDSTGASFDVEKELKIAVENKAPALVPSAKTDTLYPRAGFDDSVLTLSDKATGKPVKLTSIKYNNNEITNPVSLNKNAYDVVLEEDAGIRFTLHNGQNDNYAKGTDKITLSVESSEWTKPVSVSYSMKVDVNQPKLKLSSAKLTLNKNEASGIHQSAELTLALAGRATPFDGYVTFDGAKDMLNHVIALDDRGEGRIGVRLNLSKEELKTLSEGSYPFTLTAHKDGWANGASTTLKVDVKDFSTDKCIKVSKKGSIDVLRRSQTYIAYTPKISNLAGDIIDGWITGADAYLFESEYDAETGQLRVRARQNGMEEETWNYSTKGSYKVTPVFLMETAFGHQYEVKAAEQVVKVTQGRPRVAVLSEYGNTLYRDAGNGMLTFAIAAELSGENIAIQDVTLANYRDDLNVTYDEEMGMVTLSQTAMKEITKNAKTWGIKLAVRYADKAGNEKDAIVTYKVVIK